MHRVSRFFVGRCSGRSGGSDGRTGPSGSSGYASVSAGSGGADGSWTIQVGDDRYGSRYAPRLGTFTITSANRDGVIEPAEEVRLADFRLRNDGEAPTPPPELHASHVYLPPARNVIQPTAPLTVPWVLAHREAQVLPGKLRFHVPDVPDDAIEPNTRYVDHGLADPRARLLDAQRDYPEFPNAQRFPVGFPAGIQPLRLASAFAAGESHRVQLRVESLATQAYGEPYAGTHLDLTLRMGRVDDPERLRVIERRRLPLRVAARFQAPARDAMLLVTHVEVEREDVLPAIVRLP